MGYVTSLLPDPFNASNKNFQPLHSSPNAGNGYFDAATASAIHWSHSPFTVSATRYRAAVAQNELGKTIRNSPRGPTYKQVPVGITPIVEFASLLNSTTIFLNLG